MTKQTKKTETPVQVEQVQSKAALKKVRQVGEIMQIRGTRLEGKSAEDLKAIVIKLDTQLLMAKQAAMIEAFHETEVVGAGY